MNINCKIEKNKTVALYQATPDDTVRIFHVNDRGDFVGVAEFTAEQFGNILQQLVPENKREYWR